MTTTTTKLKPVSFAPQQNFAVGTQPMSVVVNDFNNDGKTDVATVNMESNDISVLLGDGNAGFSTLGSFAVGTRPTFLNSADFNKDGKVDLVSVNEKDNNISILLGDGKGNFGNQKTFAVGSQPEAVNVGDFNDDGIADLVVTNSKSNNVSVLLGDGQGNFGTQTLFDVGSFPYSVNVSDFNGDKKDDLVTANFYGNNVSILLGDGLGGFNKSTFFPVGTFPKYVSTGDLNGDKKVDLVTANFDGDNKNSISVLLGNGLGSFSTQTVFSVGSNPYSVDIEDFNGDGNEDLVTTDANSNSISILLGNGFGDFAPRVAFAGGTSPLSVGLADFNSDNKIDLAVQNAVYNGNIFVLLNTTEGKFVAPSKPDIKPVSPIIEDLIPTYALNVDRKTVNEGETVTFKLTTENVAEGTAIPFTFGGSISEADILGGFKTNSFVVDSKGNASLAVKFLADKFTDGQTENLTLALDSGENQTVSVKDTSLTPKTTNPSTPTGTVKIDGINKTAKSNAKDLLIGGEKNDSLTGLAGADTLRGNAGNDILNGGLGNDSIDAGNGNDTLNGGDGNDKLIAGSGDDKLDGGKDNDTLDGGVGKDTLTGGAGVDSMTGGDGDDFYFVDNVKDKVIETNSNPSTGGKDTVTSNSATYTLGENIENLILEDLQGKGTNGVGNKSNNMITGSIGDNKLEGLAGNDTLTGGDGVDTLDGGLGIDSLVGGNGDDFYIMQNTDDLIDEKPDGGIDHIKSAVSFNLGQSGNVEYLTLSGKDAIEGTGNDLDNLLQEEAGGKTNNSLGGGTGNDTLNGESGNDTLNGGDGDDELNGGDGQDVAIFTGDYLDYLITINTDAEGVPQLIVEYKNESTGILDGTDILTDVEILEFADGDRHNKADILKDLGTTETSPSAALIITGIEHVE